MSTSTVRCRRPYPPLGPARWHRTSSSMSQRRLAGYVLLDRIGHGGMAVVYRAHQEKLDRPVAVKILSENLAASNEFLERFRREARTAANLRHPNVITVHD